MKIFSADGGGYLGLATAAFITETERHFQTRFCDSFELFCGTSTGAIVALGLASGMTGSEITDLYETLGREVFKNRFRWYRFARFPRGLFIALYSNVPLRKALNDAFGDATVGSLLEKGKKVLVTSFSVTNGKPRVFKTDHSPELTRDNGYFLKDIALASAAAPFYFPVVRLTCPNTGTVESFCDGGVYANHPALIGFIEAISHLKSNADDVSVLSLSTPRSDIGQPDAGLGWLQRQVLSRGLFFWRTSVFNMMIDGTSEIAHQSLLRLIDWNLGEKSRYQRISFPKPKGLEMDIADARATATLKQLGSTCAHDGPTRNRISQFFN
ncbi:MAG: CBASS cGAMP-activated phospholipase [Pyrinomonadaceae bacterium]